MKEQNIVHNKQMINEIHQHTEKYKKLSQIALYRNLQVIQKLRIFTKSSCDVQCNVVYSYDSHKYQPDLKEDIQFYIIRTLNEEVPALKNKFSIAYVHDSLSNFLYFRNILRVLPEEILSKLGRIYLINVGVLVKIVEKLSFGAINQFLNQRIEHVQRIQNIQQKHKVTLGVTKSKLKTKDSTNVMQTEEKDIVLPTTEVIKNGLYGKQLYQYEIGQYGIPILIQSLILRLYSQTHFLKKEGIMRKSCDVEELEILQNHLLSDSNPSNFIRKYNDPYTLGGCLKKIFNNLETPLFSYQIYEIIIAYRSDGIVENDLAFAKNCIDKMQKINQRVFKYITAFLIRGIIFNYDDNKMNAHNLAVVFGPCFFRPKQYRLQDLINSGKVSSIIKLVLTNYEEVFGAEVAAKIFNLLEKQKSSMKQKQ